MTTTDATDATPPAPKQITARKLRDFLDSVTDYQLAGIGSDDLVTIRDEAAANLVGRIEAACEKRAAKLIKRPPAP